ncbi:Fur family transcriptional regulator [Xylanibacter oryzae]|jgi:Fur family transcriptional regulator, ferric uptake regulator|uniref:Fur family transcriptional regulator n=1 Tax=Xylanibacter oryzae TaxID=185293 RepID=UPI0004BCA020|nr:transcriptional repressor [Xylanibacter oryzae]MBP7357773.1 transcriptional repressor [Prevotella sp.]
MEDIAKAAAREILDKYIETTKRRKTSERYTILNAVYTLSSNFTIDELNEYLDKNCNFIVSRGTLYNTLGLFVEIHLVARYNTQSGTKYEACYNSKGHCRRVCTICGKVTEVKSKEIDKAISNTHFKRFHKNGYSVFIYGICTSCQAQMTRRRCIDAKKKNKETI